jgi:hypothetical protein
MPETALETKSFLDLNSGALTMLILCALILGALLILVPQLLRAHQRSQEMGHQERMKTLEQKLPLVPMDDRSRFAGRVALLVPSVVICAAATVTCFLVAYKSENMISVTMTIWCVAGVVSLAAITGGVALMGRLAQLSAGEQEETEQEVPADLAEKQ